MKTAFFLLSAALLAAEGVPPQTFIGVISDSMCAENHAMMKISPDSKCVRECAEKHNSKYTLLVGKNVYKLSDQQTPAAFAGQKVRVRGVLYEKTRIIKLDGIEAVK